MVGLRDHLLIVVADDDLAVVVPRPCRAISAVGRIAQQALDLAPSCRARAFPSWSAGSPASSGRARPGRAGRWRRARRPRVSSAMTSVSVGPANRSMPTRPNSWRLASATKALPGPTSMSTGAMVCGAERHRADRLDAAEAVDLVGAGQMLGRDDRRRRACPDRAARR